MRWRLPASIALVTLAGCASQSPVTEQPLPATPSQGTVVVPNARRPEFGEYVAVDELPEAIMKLDPMYPEEAKRDRIEGIVIVQALVIEDGSVAECRAIPSIFVLEDAAVACVRQWRFKPALSSGKPVAVWVTVPVRFMLP
jgi:protein TonB